MYVPAQPPAELTTILAALPRDDAERLLHAYRVAAEAHREQTRDEGTPYIAHPARVAALLWQELGSRDVDVLCAALLHDVLEDSDAVDAAFLESAFGPHVLALVQDVTKPRVPEAGKPARDAAYLAALRDAPPAARLLKLADRVDNLRGVVHANDPAKAARYLSVSRAEFLPLALMTDPTAERLIAEACDAVEAYLAGLAG